MSLAGPETFDSADPSRFCQGCARPAKRSHLQPGKMVSPARRLGQLLASHDLLARLRVRGVSNYATAEGRVTEQMVRRYKEIAEGETPGFVESLSLIRIAGISWPRQVAANETTTWQAWPSWLKRSIHDGGVVPCSFAMAGHSEPRLTTGVIGTRRRAAAAIQFPQWTGRDSASSRRLRAGGETNASGGV